MRVAVGVDVGMGMGMGMGMRTGCEPVPEFQPGRYPCGFASDGLVAA